MLTLKSGTLSVVFITMFVMAGFSAEKATEKPDEGAVREESAKPVITMQEASRRVSEVNMALYEAEKEARKADPELKALYLKMREAEKVYIMHLNKRPEIKQLMEKREAASKDLHTVLKMKETAKAKE